jgi:hypothetical protein
MSGIRVASVLLPKSLINLARRDEVPQIITRKMRQQALEFLTPSAKRLLQQYRPNSDLLGGHPLRRYQAQSGPQNPPDLRAHALTPTTLTKQEPISRVGRPLGAGEMCLICALCSFRLGRDRYAARSVTRRANQRHPHLRRACAHR